MLKCVLLLIAIIVVSFIMGVGYGLSSAPLLGQLWPMVLEVDILDKPCSKYVIKWMDKNEFEKWNGYDPSEIQCVEN